MSAKSSDAPGGAARGPGDPPADTGGPGTAGPGWRIVEGGLDDPRVAALVRAHAARARAETGRGSAHALDDDALAAPDIRFWTVWRADDGAVLGFAALRRLDPGHGEIKSMHTVEAARRQGVAGALLEHIVAAARAAGMTRLSLETGSWPYFAPARALYCRHGFVDGPPFGDYRADPNSVFLSRALDDG